MSNFLICIVGPTCAGKDTIADYLQKTNNLKGVCSHTDRPMRDGEVNGKEHIFVSKAQMDVILKDNKNVIAPTTIGGYRYCTITEVLDDAELYIIDPKGVNEIIKKTPERELVILYIDAPEYQRRTRSKEHRSDYETEFDKRNRSERIRLNDFVSQMLYLQGTNTNIHFHYVQNANGMESFCKKQALDIIDWYVKNR